MKWYAWILAVLLIACSSTTVSPVAPKPVPIAPPPVSLAPEEPKDVEPKSIVWQELTIGILTCSLRGGQALFFYYSPHCPFCQAMERVWEDPDLSTYVVESGWCTIRVNIEEEEFDELMMVYGVPWIDIMNIKAIPSEKEREMSFEFQRLVALTGYMEADELLLKLRFIREKTSSNLTHVQHTQDRTPQAVIAAR